MAEHNLCDLHIPKSSYGEVVSASAAPVFEKSHKPFVAYAFETGPIRFGRKPIRLIGHEICGHIQEVRGSAFTLPNRRVPNGTYSGVRGRAAN
jgi:hypothetical protein